MHNHQQRNVDAINRMFSATTVNAVASYATFPFDMVLRPWFGSQFYTIAQAWTGMGFAKMAILMTGVMGWLADQYLFERPSTINYQSSLFLLFALYAGFGLHVWRVSRLVRHMDREHISTTDGPALPFFKFLPKGDRWAWVRMFYEPLLISLVFTLLSALHVISVCFALYAYFGSFALFMRAACHWWEGWQFVRDRMDRMATAPVMESIAEGAQPPETLGRMVFAGIPASVPPAERKAIVGQMTGLSSDMKLLLSPVDKS